MSMFVAPRLFDAVIGFVVYVVEVAGDKMTRLFQPRSFAVGLRVQWQREGN
jgi:hypothetical protein